MKKNVSMLVLFVISAAMSMLALPAIAGMGPSWYVAAHSGQIAPWGQELVSGSIVTVDEEIPEQSVTFAPATELTTWTAIVQGNGLFSSMIQTSPPAIVEGKIWSGPGETRAYYQVDFALGGSVWGNRELTVRNSAGFPVILNVEVSSGYNQTFWFASAETYTYALTDATVPEPGSFVALLSGLGGFAGICLRRRK